MYRATIIPALIGALTIAAPAAAQAAPAWTAPAALAPAPGAGLTVASAQAFVAGTRSLVVGSDGTAPWLATGDRAGRFAARTALGAPADGASGIDADVGADGTLAVAWAAGGAAHVTVVPPSGAARPQIDLPAAGTTGVAVAVAPDASVTLAYRTKTGKTYGVDVVTAPPGGGFGAATTLDSGTAGIDSPDVAAGPGGALAVTYRRITSGYRARVAVKPAGAAAFDAPQTVSGDGPSVIRTRVAFDGDGTVVAAFANGAGAQYALRPAAATAFAAPVLLADGASALSLVPTPQGGTAAVWAGNGAIKAAIQGPGAAYGAATAIGTSTSQIVADPAIAVSPAGVATVAYADPTDGAVHVADIGGASTVVGYGAPDQANSAAIAAGADRTVVAWRDAAGGTSAVTRSDTATPGGPGTKPAPTDRTKPRITVATRSRTVKVTSKTTSVAMKVRCDEACSLSATADLATRRGSRTAHAPTRPYTSKTPRTGTQTVKLRLGSLAEKDLRKALKAGRGGHLSIDLTAADRAGNSTRTIIRLKLVKKR